MGKISKIEWTDATWNPWQGCHKVSSGCENCYMYRDKKLFGQDPAKVVRSKDKTFYAPLNWKEPRRIMVCSWSDFFIEEADKWRDDAVNIMEACPQHTFIIPTKRTERMAECLYGDNTGDHPTLFVVDEYLPNVWFLASVENQETADARITELLRLSNYGDWPVLGISAEPLLEAIDVGGYLLCDGSISEFCDDPCSKCRRARNGLDWIICGGESGPNARPMHPDWVCSLRDQAVAAGVPFFFKQWGEWKLMPQYGDGYDCEGRIEIPTNCTIFNDEVFAKVGKKTAGHLLDGREWNQMPTDCGCINCGETDMPLNDDGLCEHCYNEFVYQEERERQQKYADKLAEEKRRE